MENEIITSAASLSAAAKNIYDISCDLLSTRKRNKAISAGQMRQLENAINFALKLDSMNHTHYLVTTSRNYLKDSFKELQEYANTPFGDLLLDEIYEESQYYKNYIDDYFNLSRRDLFS